MFATPLRTFLVLIWVVLLVALGILVIDGNQALHSKRLGMAGDQDEEAFWIAMGRREKPVQSNLANNPAMAAPLPVATEPVNIVIWINISGFRTDYLTKAAGAFFIEQQNASYWTKKLMPVAPTLKLPNVATQITGLPVTKHGITSNFLRDPADPAKFIAPSAGNLKGEPVWTTAKRQGIRVLVHDWPFSHTQPSTHAADYYHKEFDPSLNDEARLKLLFDTWEKDTDKVKLRLLMANLTDLEKTSIQAGSRAEQTLEAVRNLDRILGEFFAKCATRLEKIEYAQDKIYAIVSTDRGLADVSKLVCFAQFMGDLKDKLTYKLDDSIAHIWFNGDDAAKAASEKLFDARSSGQIFWDVFPPAQFLPEWGLTQGAPDRVIMLRPDYAFTDKPGSEHVYPVAEAGGPLAACGYPVVATSRMRGQFFFFRIPRGNPGGELEEVDPARLHGTVCSLLGIKPAPDAPAEPIANLDPAP